MDFTDKYISATEKLTDTKSTKIVLSDDAYSIAEAISELIKKIEAARLSLLR